MITKAIFFKAAKRARILIRCCFVCNARLLQNVGKGGNRGVVVQIMKESRMVKNGWHKLGTKQGGHLIKNVLLLSLSPPLSNRMGIEQICCGQSWYFVGPVGLTTSLLPPSPQTPPKFGHKKNKIIEFFALLDISSLSFVY